MSERRQERKVVTVLFCDLVGFTQRAEEMDPEDVASLLEPYHARVKSELERYGGTVEKFIGDAVMALFGAPVAHEDDPERAVRAALAIRDFAEEEGIELRIGITTGEALVTLGARPDEGETMATGDVVNTAARLQAAAPVNGILVSAKTHAATTDAIEYEPATAVEAKGKSKPIDVWRARRARGRVVLDRLHATPLVGRVRELDLLIDALHRARAERQPQLVTLVGVPGIGKSRLTYELSRAVDRDPELISWRQGRCLPYGEGVTYWALGEIVKAHLGVLETDVPEVVEGKLHDGVADEWVRRQVRPLVGLATDTPGREGEGHDEAFAAWRRFLEDVAAQRPLVVVIEDLHWADENLLDFVDHLVDWASGVALLVVCTARPELLERRSTWGGGKTNALTISLSPLSDADTSRLVAGVIQRAVMPAETQNALLARAGGNPLYAEQFARLLEERPGDELPLPETVQGIISARLDGLDPEQKALLQDAAVVGKVFWSGALSSLSGTDRGSAEQVLHVLERRGFVRRERESSIENDTEYSFLHVLVREVAYGQIPRAPRSAKHRSAAAWIEGLGRSDDQAELLAHHYEEALELARAARLDTAALEEPARLALRDAGDRAYALHAYAAALRLYERALELWPEGDPQRPHLAYRRARSYFFGVDEGRTDLLEDARDALLENGDRETAAEAGIYLAWAMRAAGQPLESVEVARQAAGLLERAASSEAHAFVLANWARTVLHVARHIDEAGEIAAHALAMAQELGLEELRANALATLGFVRVSNDDFEGLAELEESLEIMLKHGSPFELGRAYNNLMFGYWAAGRIEQGNDLLPVYLEVYERYGLSTTMPSGVAAFDAYYSGRWDEAERRLDETHLDSPDCEDPGLVYLRACLRLARDDIAGAVLDCNRALELPVETWEPTELASVRVVAAAVALADGRFEDAELFVDQILAGELEFRNTGFVDTTELALLLDRLGRSADGILESANARPKGPWLQAAAAVARGQLAEAADRLADLGCPTVEAAVRSRAAERLVAEGRRSEADVQLQAALAFYRSVGATRYVREAEALLAATA